MESKRVFNKAMGQRVLSLMLVTIMVVGLFPPIPVHAADEVYGVLMSDGRVYATTEGNMFPTDVEIDRMDVTHLYVDEGVTSIEQNAFDHCDNLTMVSMPSVTTIGNSAFAGCSKLETVFQPNVISIGDYSFMNCGSLSSVDLPEVLSIGGFGFVACEALVSVTSPKLATLGDYVFDSCPNFMNLTLGAIPPTVGSGAFGGIRRTNLNIPDGSVPSYASANDPIYGVPGYWYGWPLLYSLTVNGGISSDYYRTGSLVSIIANEPEEGKQFKIWSEEGTDKRIVFDHETAANTSFLMPGKDTIITSVYEDVPATIFNVTFNENNGTGVMATQAISQGSSSNLNANVFTRAGYSFAGWNTLANGLGTTYLDGALFTAIGDITLYAQWTQNASPAADPGYGVLRSNNKIYTTNIGNTKTDGVEMNKADVTHLYVANDVTSIASNLFANRLNLIEVNAPSVTTVGFSAFSGCTNLATINFPEATSLGGSVFRLCKSLTTVSLPKVAAVNSYEFMDCINLTTADLPESIILGEKAFDGCTKLTTLTLPKLTTIGTSVFTKCVGLTAIDLPSVTEIGDYAFFDCSGLTSINLPVATTIGKCAFNGCNVLTTVDLPLLTTLSDYAFGWMDGLTSVRLPAITSIGMGAFYASPHLANLAIGVSPPTVGADAFHGCLKTNISFIGATTIDDIKQVVRAYENAYAITNPDDVVGYWYGWALPHVLRVTDGVVNSPSDTGLYPTGTTISITANTPPDGQRFVNWGTMQDRGIGDDEVVFADANATTTTFVMPGQYTSIFAGFEAMPQYTVTFDANGGSGSMPVQLFNEAETKNLTHNVFVGVDCLFAGWNTQADGSGTAYADDASFALSTDITLYAQWIYDYGVLRDDGKVYMTNQDNTKTDGQLINKRSVKHLFVDADVTIIEEAVFQNCPNLVTVDLSKVPSLIIEKDAFHGCTGLTTIDLKNVTSVGYRAFGGCEVLTTIDLQNATEIGIESFSNCSALSLVNIPNVISIPKGAFYECSNLTTIDLSKVTTIGELSFALCTKLKTVDLLAVTTVGMGSFGLCSSLETVDLPVLTTASDYLFFECTALKTVSLPKATELKEGVFSGCTVLTDLTVSATPPIVGADVFKECSSKTNLIIDGGNTVKAIGDYNAVDDGDVRDNYWYDWQLKVNAYALTVTGGTGSGNFAQGSEVTITAGTAPTGQRFKSWTQDGVTLAKATDATTTFVMPGNAVMVTAEYEVIPVLTHTVTYNANGGTGSMTPQVFTGTTSQNLNINTLTRTGFGFSGWSTNPLATTATYVDGASYTATEDITLYALWTEGKYDVAGTVGSDVSHLLANVRVTLMRGNVQIGETTTNTEGFFTIKDVCPGNYNLVVVVDETKVTTLVNVVDGPPDFSNIIVPPSQKTNSVVEVKADTPAIVVGNLENQFTPAEKASTDFIEIKFVADGKDNTAPHATDISNRAASNGRTVGMFIDFSVLKTINSAPTETLSELPDLIEVLIPLDVKDQGKTNYVIYRYHGSDVNAISETTNADGERIDLIDGGATIKLTAKKFSTYAVAYGVTTPPGPGPGPGPTPVKTYELSYDANGGSGTMVKQVFTESIKQALVKNTFVRTDYTFSGWNTKADGTGTAYADKADFTAVATSTLYAQWTENKIIDPAGVTYRTHIQNIGWENTWAKDGAMAGTEGRSLRLEGIEIKLTGNDLPEGAHIEYLTHIQNDGWETDWSRDGEMSGTEGRSLRLEGIKIRLVNMPGYSVEYRTHIQNDGWETKWSKDGEMSGTEGRSLRLEGIEIKIVKN